ncbi:hypothetical protein MZB74_23415 [Escherichia coli]|uniref:Uncharacterized protein n=1 Tax=Escherichia coli TaxID=562 RepID=A0A3Z9NX88_ECOLX|nr:MULTISPECIES: hypothetical protein [Escherichia]EEZ9823879.1 hypothetical protein [Escherichia coli O91]ELP2870275.1 hypothetical protein [Escherichia coli O8]UYE91735.1 hypothetical protein [Escherichia phage phi458]HDQ6924724.1 hypothetical protein [Escherichia coli Ou:H7]EAC1685792.1 hypothetical protein [Escherichia coli]
MVNQQQQQQQINENLKIEAIRWYQKLQEITYLEAGQHMRALNQLMWQIPSFVIAVNGGLWYATTLANESSLWIIFAVLALFDFTTMITLYRLRSLIGSKIALQKNIEDPSKNYILNEITRDAGFKLPSSYDNKETGYIVVSCWAIMLIVCFFVNIAGVCHPNLFSKDISHNTYKATIKNIESGLFIEAKSGLSK